MWPPDVARVVVRPAEPGDAPVVGTLTEAVYRAGGFTDDDYAVELRDAEARIRDAHVLVAELDGHIVGSLAVTVHGEPLAELARTGEAEVRMLAVVEEARGRGVAGRLMDGAEALARQLGATAMILSTEPDMHAAHRIYERRGYVRVPERDWTVGSFDLLAYWRSLA